MLVVALDTTTRTGSVALVRGHRVLAVREGDGGAAHATRLPGDVLGLLRDQGFEMAEVDVFGVAVGPGSFTGLRIGLASVQGLAFASGKPVVGVSAFDALAAAAWAARAPGADGPVAMWLDAQRLEVYAAAVRVSGDWDAAIDLDFEYLDPPSVAAPQAVLDRWSREAWWREATVAGGGALAYREVMSSPGGLRRPILDPTPLLAPAIGKLAERLAGRGLGVAPHALKPMYVRRPDAELARDRRRAGGP
ncbi:MAG: tRNA (adenosine(37)-N6)-threonylcarbamoyltransferase complex dimerization subunit type 1 TsaB [Acidobacteriota bacterium]